MSDDTPRFDGTRDTQPHDPFAPGRVDEAIAFRLNQGNTLEDDEARLVAALTGAYALSPEAEAALARVRARLRQAARRSDVSEERNAHRPMRTAPPFRAEKRETRRHAVLRAVAAALVVALLGGGFFALLHGRPGAGSANGWSDVGITHARLASPLDFAPAHGLTYAVAETGGMIYACDANHLWYSTDNGRSYAPFPLAYPVSDTSRPNELCNMNTAPGAPGIFVVTYGQQTQIHYAEAGDGDWRTLGIPDTVVDVGNGGHAAPLDASDIANAVISYPDHSTLRAAGNWLFVLPHAASTRLVATPDFGTTWYQLDTPLEAQGLQCVGFTVAPDDPAHVYCGTIGAPGTSTGSSIWESVDGGAHWRELSLPASYGIVAEQAGGAYLYVLENGPGINETLWRHAITGGIWEQIATLPQPEFNTAPMQPRSSFALQDWSVGPDDTNYAWLAYDDGKAVTARVFALLPGSSAFTEVGSQSTMAFAGKSLTLELGDTSPDDSPALYLHDRPVSASDASQPLYRLALPSGSTHVRLDTTPLPPPAPTATATPIPPTPCTSAAGTLAAIQPGGIGATVDTFDTRWGQHHGAAAGSLYFGPSADGGNWVVQAAEPASNNRVYRMSYRLDASKKTTLTQAEAIASSILPRDATQTAGSHATPNGTEANYCSAALIAAFPPSVTQSAAPLFHDGRIAVLYDVDSAGNIVLITFEQHTI